MYHSDGYVSWLWLLRAQADGDERGSHLVRSVLLNLDIEFFFSIVFFVYCVFLRILFF